MIRFLVDAQLPPGLARQNSLGEQFEQEVSHCRLRYAFFPLPLVGLRDARK